MIILFQGRGKQISTDRWLKKISSYRDKWRCIEKKYNHFKLSTFLIGALLFSCLFVSFITTQVFPSFRDKTLYIVILNHARVQMLLTPRHPLSPPCSLHSLAFPFLSLPRGRVTTSLPLQELSPLLLKVLTIWFQPPATFSTFSLPTLPTLKGS